MDSGYLKTHTHADIRMHARTHECTFIFAMHNCTYAYAHGHMDACTSMHKRARAHTLNAPTQACAREKSAAREETPPPSGASPAAARYARSITWRGAHRTSSVPAHTRAHRR